MEKNDSNLKKNSPKRDTDVWNGLLQNGSQRALQWQYSRDAALLSRK